MAHKTENIAPIRTTKLDRVVLDKRASELTGGNQAELVRRLIHVAHKPEVKELVTKQKNTD